MAARVWVYLNEDSHPNCSGVWCQAIVVWEAWNPGVLCFVLTVYLAVTFILFSSVGRTLCMETMSTWYVD